MISAALNIALIIALSDPTAPAKVATASIYHSDLAGKKTSSGERYNPEDTTAAHKELPLGSRVKLKNPETGKETDVRINDRGPNVRGREFDLSEKSAEKLGIPEEKGKAKVEAVVISTPTPG